MAAIGASFNPRARVGRDVTATATEQLAASFNPRARVGRDDTWQGFVALSDVSIHAPAWGATGKLVE